MKKRQVDWYYHRLNCNTCQRADEFLAAEKIPVAQQQNARKERFTPEEALKLARSARHVFATRGKKVVHFDMQAAPPDDEELTRYVVGPSGNLRAPALRVGDRLFIGFDESQIAESLWGK
jgi:arsenate reductase-like glutaredoxin family protein